MRIRAYLLALSGLTFGLCRAQTVAEASGGVFHFREPQPTGYRLEAAPAVRRAWAADLGWVRAWPENGSTHFIELGSRVVLQVGAPGLITNLLASSPARVDRVIASNLFVLQAPDALTAAREAQRLAGQPGVEVSHPVRRRPVRLHSPFAARPNDPYFGLQWHLEHRDTNTGAALGPDLNVRGAWAYARGEGVVVAIGDDGVELDHPDLAAHSSAANHFNFVTGVAGGLPLSSGEIHGTAVAGLAVAVGNNRRGVAGVAPGATFASWVVFDTSDFLVNEEKVADMFQFRSNVVSVQNHSWGNALRQQLALGSLENAAIANAVAHGRGGRGVVLVRSAGNDRAQGNDGNDDGYAQDPRQMAVGAVRVNGRAAAFSTPGANVLVAAFSGERNVETPHNGLTNYPTLTTTDRQGVLGYNSDLFSGDPADYTTTTSFFAGTSASAPQIAGLAALVLSANSNLTYRDVQQVLLLSARQTDPTDPDTTLNGAGLAVNHNTGFGVPDAGQAVVLARAWLNRPPMTSVTVTSLTELAIPDDGLRVVIQGNQVPAGLASIPAYPSQGVHPATPTAALPLVDVGQALRPLTNDLTGLAALIQRGTSLFVEKIAYAAAAGARFVIVYNNVNFTERIYMTGPDIHLAPIPAVFIGQSAGEALRTHLQSNPGARAQVALEAARYTLLVTNTLQCEHVALRVRFSHPQRADVRLTLISPAGTRSVLHHLNEDFASPLGDWTFYSTHHFYESSAGAWQVEVGDERPGRVGRVFSLALTIRGISIEDTDQDGLDDRWELEHLSDLAQGPRDDPDGDGYNNLRESVLGTDPLAIDAPFQIELAPWNERLTRLSWPSTTNLSYRVLAGTDASAPLSPVAELAGGFPETEWFTSYTNLNRQFFRLQAIPLGP
jgi:subtilisin family serine protease/subtilisin-like proprotein convertase family protein